MGCVGSKPEDTPAVALCRQRCHFLDEAIHQRYVLSEAHLAYFHSLKSVGDSLHRFFDLHSSAAGDAGDSSPVLNLPSQRKGDTSKPPPPAVGAGAGAPAVTHRRSNSGSSHLHFNSDSDSDDDESLHLHSEKGGSSPANHLRYGNFSYSDQQDSYIPAVYPYPTAGYSPVEYPYSPAGFPPAGYSSGGYTVNYMRKQPTPSVLYQQKPMSSEPIHYGEASSSSYYSSSSYNNSYDNQNPNLNSYGEFFGSTSQQPPYGGVSSQVVQPEGPGSGAADVHYRSVPNVVAKEEDPVEYEVHVVDKEVVEDQKKPLVYNSDSEVVKEIQTQFYRASESGGDLAKILEVGKVPHNRKHNAYQVPSKMLNGFTPLLALAPADPANLDVDVDLLTKSKNLSSTLHKLYLWEKKLFDEVKIEEKMRVLHEEKKQRLVRLDEKGAEHHKVDATRTLIRSLSTKIRIAIQVVDKIAQKINTLRDEELWPQLNDFIEGLTKMWRSMLECHHIQCEAIGAAKRIDSIASHKHSSDASLDATLQLEHELLNWAIRFSCWFGAQKGFVRALNEWLLKSLMYEPEETVDGPVPYSPGRIGAPAIFIICNQWAQAMQTISDKEVVDSMRNFATTVLQLWERDKGEMRQRTVVDKNHDRNLDKEDQKILKELQMLDKMIVVSSGNDMSLGHHVYQSETSTNVSLQTSLQRVFESMERFTSASLKAYEELLRRIQEDNLAR
ncbi:hypothetical protein HanIR_Chr12g0591721 [Helianthus annuus]|nr:hypothetical protein HanIR_Chr12g0591721 [Helianthus annuus]